ncbi:MAG: hypothetical protein JNK97_15400 [Zoogloea sp.]|nr:hypothetical protein [Zoogloea sp.]
MPGFRHVLLPAFVGTLASFAPSPLIGAGIFMLALALLARALPVEAAPTDTAGPKSNPALVTWLLGVAAVGVFSLRVNFFPNTEVAMGGLGAAVFVSFVMTRWSWGNDAMADQRAHLHVLGFPIWVFMHYLLFAAVLPAWPAYQLGEARTFQAQVLYKGGSTRLGACKTKIELDTEGMFFRWRICLPEAQWTALKKGDAVVVTTSSSWLGDYVLRVAPDAGAAAR